MCVLSSDIIQDVLVISDNRFFLLGIKHYYRECYGSVVTISNFHGQALDNYLLRMSIISLLDRTPSDVRLILAFHDDRVMRAWVCEARRQGRDFLNMVETPEGRIFRGRLSFLMLSSRMTLTQFDCQMKQRTLPPALKRYTGSFGITDMLLEGKDMKQIADLKGIPEKTLYGRLRALNHVLDLVGLNTLYWLRMMRLCADYDAMYPALTSPDARLMYQALSVVA